MSSDCAMATKARAMFGNRLKEEDYFKLLQKKSVGEVAYALRHETYFSETLEGINEKAIHRGALETLLKMDLFTRLRKLLRYASDDDAQFVYCAVMNVEVQILLMCIRSFSEEDGGNSRSEMIQHMPIYISKYLSFPIEKLADVYNFHDLLEVLKETSYEPIIRRYAKDYFEEIDYIGLEHDLRVRYYDTLLKMIHQYTKGAASEEMQKDTLTRVEMDNISIIYRLKKFFKASPDDIKKLITPMYASFNEREMNHLIYDCNGEEVIEALQKKYRRYIGKIPFTNIEHYTHLIRFQLNHHFIEYYTEPALVLLSYMLLSEMEIDNVINIIEGVRYHIQPERIKKMLVY